jgi:PAS domain S-box-containing protein
LAEHARILELSHDSVIIYDKNGVIGYWNDGAENLYGWSREEAVGRRCQELLLTEFPAAEVGQSCEVEGRWSGEIVRTRRDGTRLTLASRWVLRRDAEGRPIGVIESSADLTEQRRADLQIKTSERRYRTIFDAAGFAIWESDWAEAMRIATASAPSGSDLAAWLSANPDILRAALATTTIRNANEATAILCGAASRETLVGMNLGGRYMPKAVEPLANLVAALAKGAARVECEIQARTLDDRVVDVVLRVTVPSEDARWSNLLVMAVDVTERNDARARMEQAHAELAHAARVSMLGQLASSIAHEVNQPLTAIINYGKSAKRFLGRPEPDLLELDGCLEKILSNGTRAADIVGRVRGLARKAAPEIAPLDIADLIDDTIALIQREAHAQSVTIVRLRTASVPIVIADRVQVQQVLMNLLINGIQAMAEITDRFKELSIEITPFDDGFIEVAVMDCGSGFPAEREVRMFEPFFTTKADGMGMGLSICRSIVEHQGGRISARNNPVHGSTVAFTLPCCPPLTAEPVAPHILI